MPNISLSLWILSHNKISIFIWISYLYISLLIDIWKFNSLRLDIWIDQEKSLVVKLHWLPLDFYWLLIWKKHLLLSGFTLFLSIFWRDDENISLNCRSLILDSVQFFLLLASRSIHFSWSLIMFRFWAM